MTNVNSKAFTTNESAHPAERAAAPILLIARDLEAVAAAGKKPNAGVSGGAGATA